MTIAFDKYDFLTANQQLEKVKADLVKTEANRLYLNGDDWQGGNGWVGPQFTGNGEVSRNLKTEIEREFASKGSIRAIVRRHRRGVAGRVPSWLISSRNAPSNPDAETSAEDTGLIAEAQKILNEFWKNSDVHETYKQSVNNYLVSDNALLRLFFVQDIEGNEAEPASTIEDAVKMIHLFSEEPGSGTVILNKETLKRASFYRSEKDGRIYIEMCYVDDEGMTVFKTFSQTDGLDFAQKNFPTIAANIKEVIIDNEPTQLPLGGKLLVYEMKGAGFISGAMRSQQKLVNKALTMMSHNVDMDGFRSRVLMNALPPGKYEKDASGTNIFVPDPNQVQMVGAGTVQYVNGIPQTVKEEGKITTVLTTPSIHESQPISPQSFIETADAASECMLEEADQKHVSISGDASASGESLKQQRHAFLGSLEDTKSDVDATYSKIFECVLAIVAYLMDSPDKYAGLQVSFNAILNPGPVSGDDQRVAMEAGDKKYRSREDVMEQIGVIDPDAMKSRIKQEEEENPPLIIPDPNNPPEGAVK